MNICRKCGLDTGLALAHRKPEFCLERAKEEIAALRVRLGDMSEELNSLKKERTDARPQSEAVRDGRKPARPR